MKKSNKKIVLWSAVVLMIVLSVLLLYRNKTVSEARAKKNIAITEYPVTVQPVAYENLDISLEYVGTIVPRAESNISSEISGKVVGVFADLGDFVPKGKLLVKLDDELKLANLQTAEASYTKAKKDLERLEKLYKENSVSETQLEQARFAYQTAEAQLKIAKKQLEDTKIVAPFSATIASRNVEVGMVVSPGTVLFNLADISTPKVKIYVPEKDIFFIKKGSKVEIKSDYLPNRTFFGKVISIGTKADETKNFPVEIILDSNPENILKAGMFVRVRIPSAISGKSLLIPRESLVGSAKNPKVYVVENNLAILKDITLGIELGRKLEVLHGLKEGDLVVTNGLINLKDSTKVRIVEY